MPPVLLTADRLTRTFADRTAVCDLSLSVAAGEVVALLGPNGAGKTTTMRMLAGLILPTSGSVRIDGVEITRATADATRSAVGLLTEAPGLWERLTVRLNLLTYARLHGMQDASAQVDRVLSLVDLADRADDLAGKLSKGLKQRAALARALIHRPAILLLDEPTSGLDPASARHVRDLIAQFRQEGRAVLVSTHNLVEAEELADRIAIIKTRLLALDSVDALRRTGAGTKVVFDFEDGSTETVAITDVSEVPELVRARVDTGKRLIRVTPDRRSLEEVYLDLVGADA